MSVNLSTAGIGLALVGWVMGGKAGSIIGWCGLALSAADFLGIVPSAETEASVLASTGT